MKNRFRTLILTAGLLFVALFSVISQTSVTESTTPSLYLNVKMEVTYTTEEKIVNNEFTWYIITETQTIIGCSGQGPLQCTVGASTSRIFKEWREPLFPEISIASYE